MRYLICQISIDIANFYVLKSVKINNSKIILQENEVKLKLVCALVHIHALTLSLPIPPLPAKCGCRAFVRSCRVEFDNNNFY